MMKKITLFRVLTLVAIVAGMAPRAFAQTYVPMHARMLMLAGNDTGVTNTLTLQVAALSGSSTLTLPGGNAAGVLLNNGSGTLSWVPVSTIVSGLYLPTAGGSMTGNIDMGTNNITNATSITATTFNGSLNGNASSATTATSFSGSLSGDVTGTQSATAINTTSAAGGHIITALTNNAGTLTNNTSGTAAGFTGSLVGDVTGTQGATVVSNVSSAVIDAAGTITNNTSGNAATATSATNFSGSLAGEVTGSQGATQINTTSAAGGHIITALTNNAGTLTNNTSGTAAGFTGSLSGDVTGTQGATAINTSSAAGGHIISALTANAGTITNNTSGNAATATSATSFSGSLSGDVTGTQGATAINTTSAAGGHIITALTNNAGTITNNTSGNAAGFTGSLTGDVTGTQGATAINTSSAAGGHIIAALTANAGSLANNTSGNAAGFTGSLNGDVTGTQGSTSVVKILGNAIPANASGALTNNGTGTLTWTPITSLTNPMNTLGDMIYGGASGTATRLAGNITPTKMFLTSTGSAGNATAPSWGTLSASDVPTLNQNTTGTAANVTGIISLAHGGTGQDNTTGVGSTAVFAGNGSGGATFRTLTSADIPSLTGNYIANGTSHQASPSNFNIDTGTALVFAGQDGTTGTPLTVRGGNGSSTTAGSLTLEAGGTTSGSGAGVSILGRNAHVSGAGGNIAVTAGNAAGTNMAGGNITLMPGSATGSGTPGGVGINTSSPNVDLDINGDWSTRSTTLNTTTTTLNNVSTAGTSNILITGETGAFTVTGFSNGYEGKRLRIYNKTGQNMTIANESGSSSTGNKINTLSGGDITLVGNGSVELVYDNGSTSEWVAASTIASQVTGIVGTPQNLLRSSTKGYTSATLTNDTDFAWNVGANQTWELDGVLSDSADNNNSTLGIALNIPGTPTGISVAVFGAPIGSNPQLSGSSLLTTNNTVCQNPLSNGTTKIGIAFIHGVITTGATSSGTAFVKFSNAAATGNIYVRAESYMRLTRIQ